MVDREAGGDQGTVLPTSLKRHKLGTNRKNVGDGYHGCVAVSVRRYRALYWRIEGLVAAMLR
jgi:hypothetical protein